MHLPLPHSALSLLLPLLTLLPSSLCTSLTFTLPAHTPPSLLPHASSTTLTLTRAGHRTYHTPLLRSNTFHIDNLAPGSYLAEVHSLETIFVPLRVDVSSDGKVETWMTFRGNEWGNKGERRKMVDVSGAGGGVDGGVDGGESERKWSVELVPAKKVEMFVKREGFSPLKLLTSPMMLIAVVGLAGVILVPKLIDNMDPEMRAEFEREQKNSILAGGAAGANPFANFDAAKFLAGATGPSTPSPALEVASSGGKKGGAGKRR